MHVVTVDELSYRLKRVAQKRRWDKENKVKHDEQPSMPRTPLPPRNDVASALEYINKRFFIGIEMLGLDHLKEDARSCILYDLANLPLDMVVQRMKAEGAQVV